MACMSTWPMAAVGVMLIWSFHAFVNAETCNQVEVQDDDGTYGNAMLQTGAKPYRATAEETDVMAASEEAEDLVAHKDEQPRKPYGARVLIPGYIPQTEFDAKVREVIVQMIRAGELSAKGAKGEKGDAGPKGAKGDAGPKGETGPNGGRGERGATGPAGNCSCGGGNTGGGNTGGVGNSNFVVRHDTNTYYLCLPQAGDNEIKCWSYDKGAGSRIAPTIEQVLKSWGDLKSVAIGAESSPLVCAILKSNSTVKCVSNFQEHNWMYDLPGKALKIENPQVGPVAQVVVGQYKNACAVTTNKKLRCWGSGFPEGAQYFKGGTNQNVKAVAIGDRDTPCVILEDDTVDCSAAPDRMKEFRPPTDLGEVLSLSSSERSFCAVKKDKTAACWGVQEATIVPKDLKNVRQIEIGNSEYYGCALFEDDVLQCWQLHTSHCPHNKKVNNVDRFIHTSQYACYVTKGDRQVNCLCANIQTDWHCPKSFTSVSKDVVRG